MAKKESEHTTKSKKSATTEQAQTIQQADRRTAQKLLIGILIATVIALSLMLALRYFVNANVTYIGKIEGNSTMRVGEQQRLTLQLGDVEVKEGAQVSWYVENKRVYTGRYSKGQQIAIDIAPMHTGNYNVRVNVGTGYTQVMNVKVKRPLLSVVVPNASCYYGDEQPQVTYSIKGYIDGYGGQCPQGDVAVVSIPHQKVGNYVLEPKGEIVCDGYDVEVITGTLSVLPLPITVHCDRPIVKTYDGTDNISGYQLTLKGVKEGDEVYVNVQSLHFTDKNVGKQKAVDLQRITLEGEDACNYVIDTQNSKLNGTITPKVLDISGMSAQHKNYDGTASAQLDQIGTLNGVIEGDEVALGSIKAKFEDSLYGKDKTVVVSDIRLVGADKDNYTVATSIKVKADVFANYMDFLLRRPNTTTKEAA